MTQSAIAKLNNDYLRLPLGVKGLRLSAALLVGDVFSFTGKDKYGNELTCKRTYKTFVERLNRSRATVGRALKSAKEQGFIRRDGEKGYVCEIKGVDEFSRIPRFVMTEEFKIRKTLRKLNPSEVEVYGYFYTHCDNEKKYVKVCEVSERELAAALGLNTKTVHKAIWALLRAKLIYRPEKDKGVNGYRISKFTLNAKILAEYGIYLRRNEEAKEVQEQSEPEPKKEFNRVEYEQYYYDLQAKAEAEAARNLAIARRDRLFREADDELKLIGASLPMLIKYPEEIIAMQVRQGEAERLKAERTRELGFTKESFKPKCRCKICGDTGYKLDTGQLCNCYPPWNKG